MSAEKFIKNKTVLITLISACLIVIISLGIRQTFGMFYFDFSVDLDITLSQFGFAIGLQMFLWGAFAPWFGVITDKYGGHIAVFIGFIFYLLGILMLVSEYNTGLYFVTGIGVLIGVALGGTAISIPVSVVQNIFHNPIEQQQLVLLQQQGLSDILFLQYSHDIHSWNMGGRIHS